MRSMAGLTDRLLNATVRFPYIRIPFGHVSQRQMDELPFKNDRYHEARPHAVGAADVIDDDIFTLLP